MGWDQDMLDLSPFVHFVKDQNGHYIQVNSTYEKTLGLDRNEIIGKKDEQIFPPEMYNLWKERERRIFRENKHDQFEITLNHEGVDRTFLVYYGPHNFTGRGDQNYMAWILELTERKNSENNLMRIIDALGSGYLLIDPDTRTIRGTNRKARELIGFSENQIIGEDCQQFICKMRNGECPIVNHGMKVENMDGLLRKCNGATIPIVKTIIPVMQGSKRYLLESFTDISGQKEREEHLNKAIGELEKFTKFVIDREERMIELKEEINQLCEELGRKKRYKIDQIEERSDE